MKAVLDTRTFLWWNMDDLRLSATAREIISDGRNRIFLSAVSVWEMVVKVSKGRLLLPDAPAAWIPSSMASNRFSGLSVEISHTLEVYRLPAYHNDPFERLLAAQCRVEKLPLLSADSSLQAYGIEVLW